MFIARWNAYYRLFNVLQLLIIKYHSYYKVTRNSSNIKTEGLSNFTQTDIIVKKVS